MSDMLRGGARGRSASVASQGARFRAHAAASLTDDERRDVVAYLTARFAELESAIELQEYSSDPECDEVSEALVDGISKIIEILEDRGLE